MRQLKYMLPLAALAALFTFVVEPAHARIGCYAMAVRTAHGNTPYPIKKGEIVEINSYEKSTGMVGVYRLGMYKLKDFANFSQGCNWKRLRENGGD
jgi:hypothetical protein